MVQYSRARSNNDFFFFFFRFRLSFLARTFLLLLFSFHFQHTYRKIEMLSNDENENWRPSLVIMDGFWECEMVFNRKLLISNHIVHSQLYIQSFSYIFVKCWVYFYLSIGNNNLVPQIPSHKPRTSIII